MAKTVKTAKKLTNLFYFDSAAFLLSLWYVYSVIGNTRELIQHDIKSAPASYALIAALILIAISWNSTNRLSTWNIVTMTILGTASTIWMLGVIS